MKTISKKELAAWAVLFVVLGLPALANAGVADILSLIKTITSTLQNGIGGPLQEIQAIHAEEKTLREQVVWPVSLLDQTKGFVSQLRSQLGGLAGQIHALPVASATLPNTSAFESVFRGGQITSLSQIPAAYGKVFRPLPPDTDAHADQRNMADMDDAMAMGTLKTAIVADQTSEQMLGVADSMERQTSASASGSVVFLSAEAQVASLQNEALMQKMLAAELRQEAARLAHANAIRKQRALATSALGQELEQILSRP